MRVTDILFHETTFHDISLTTIAKRLEWSRGNLYKYVTTKEEIFLELYREKHRAWIDAVAEEFAASEMLPPESFAKRWSQVLATHVDFLKYQNILAIIIETNIPLEVLAEFKKNIWMERQSLIDVISIQCPWLTEKEIRNFILLQIYHGSGLYNHIHLTPNLREALRMAEVKVSEVDFATAFSQFFQTYMLGMRAATGKVP